MPEYMRIDATALLNVAVLITFALLTGSLIMSILSGGVPFRIRIDGATPAYDPPVPRAAPSPVPMAVHSTRYRPVVPYRPVEYFQTPMIPGGRETTPLTTFGVPAVVAIQDSSTNMDAATIAARQREGGGAPSERRTPRQGSMWMRLKETLQRLIVGS